MDSNDFRKHGRLLVDWMAEYLESVEGFPVKAGVEPKDILNNLPALPPEQGEPFGRIFDDFKSIVLPGVTHWQHPSFFAYFPANASPPSILAEMLTACLGLQCMSWVTSPAATELEERMMEWLRAMLQLPQQFTGCIQDTASTATLCALLSARERATGYQINELGFPRDQLFTAYCSSQAHSSVEKAVKIAGLGRRQLRLIGVDENYAMDPELLSQAIEMDLAEGRRPLFVVAAIGTTSSTAIDPLKDIAAICRRHRVWLHVDAAFAGTAAILPEFQWMLNGVEDADSLVFNPHKWMFTNFDCSAYFVKDKESLVRTFEILPEFLKTAEDGRVNNYRDWGIQLGRRFRALKLWFVIRNYGVTGLQQLIRKHIAMAQQLAEWLSSSKDFELLAPVPLNTICFRYKPSGVQATDDLNRINKDLLERLNATGRIYMTHTKLAGVYALRTVIGQTAVEQRHVREAWDLIQSMARASGELPGKER
jgi:aromatic-L-amino-acid decarboxylase